MLHVWICTWANVHYGKESDKNDAKDQRAYNHRTPPNNLQGLWNLVKTSSAQETVYVLFTEFLHEIKKFLLVARRNVEI